MVSLQTNGHRKNRKSTNERDQNGSTATELLFEARLRRLNLPTLKYRRLQGDMFQVLNIVSEKYTTNPTGNFNLSNVFYTIKYNLPLCIIFYVNISLVILGLLQYGIVFLTLLLMQSLLKYL